jgi:hypothetical protein
VFHFPIEYFLSSDKSIRRRAFAQAAIFRHELIEIGRAVSASGNVLSAGKFLLPCSGENGRFVPPGRLGSANPGTAQDDIAPENRLSRGHRPCGSCNLTYARSM